jgi:hypothetical protein
MRNAISRNCLPLGRHGHRLLLLVGLEHLPKDGLKGLNKIARIFNEEIGQVTGWHERALSEPPGRQSEKDAERFDEGHDAGQNHSLVKVG